MLFYLKRMLLKRFNVVGKHKTSLVLHVKCSKCVLRFNQIWILCSVDRASRYNCVNQNQLDAQLIISIFRQPLHVSGVSRPIIRRYNLMYTKHLYLLFFLDNRFLSWLDCSNLTRTTKSHLKRIISTNCCLMSHRACCHTCYTIQLMHYSHFKTQSLQHLKPIKC